MKSILLYVMTIFLFTSVSRATSEPILYFGTCFMYKGAYAPSKNPGYKFYLTTQGQVRPSWPLSFPGNKDRFRINREWLDVYTIVNQETNEILAEQNIHDGTALDIGYHDPISDTSVRCIKTKFP